MYGAMLGDIIGSPYEFDRGKKVKDFPFFDKGCGFTDDTVMTAAVAEALMDVIELQEKMGTVDEEKIRCLLVDFMQKWGKKYPNAGYGYRFSNWLLMENPKPYNSFGNGSAMRVSAAGWLFDDLETVRKMARLTSDVTHNHPEGIKGAESVASAIFMARIGKTKEEIKEYIQKEFRYDFSRTCDEIRPVYRHVESCQETVPEAFTAFFEANGFEDVIRTAVSLGGDVDTLTAIAGSMAEAFYGVPEEFKEMCRLYVADDILEVADRFWNKVEYKVIK